jgi:hypothetical protein
MAEYQIKIAGIKGVIPEEDKKVKKYFYNRNIFF